jgi:hypothetical protein
MPANKSIRINLTEQEGWQRYDTASGDVDFSDHAWQSYKYMGDDDIERYLNDIAETPAKLKRRKLLKLDLSHDQLRYLRHQLREADDRLDEPRRMITDALQWMYEAAWIPSDGDIEYAMKQVSEEIMADDMNLDEELFSPVVNFYPSENRRGPKAWSPRGRKFLGEEVAKQISDAITLSHEKDHWDRYLDFDFWSMPVTKQLLKIDPSPEMHERIEKEFNSFFSQYVYALFRRLEKIMANVDIDNRADWRQSWKSMLEDGYTVNEARKGLATVAAEMPEDWDE